ncbi:MULTISPECIES: DUF2635 domain-containing protein [unclassified Vibrio]|uniref:DUF2635 domain-containing protein n=1 Tax=unclassified Vibrio TaxID=2614977 RepID=UPI00354E790D
MSLKKNLIPIKPKNAEVPVRKPEGGFVNAAGEEVERTGYWVRRINDGDVVLVPQKDWDAAKAALAKEKADAIEQQKKALAKEAKATISKTEGE